MSDMEMEVVQSGEQMRGSADEASTRTSCDIKRKASSANRFYSHLRMWAHSRWLIPRT